MKLPFNITKLFKLFAKIGTIMVGLLAYNLLKESKDSHSEAKLQK